MAQQAIAVLYQLSESPDKLAATLCKCLAGKFLIPSDNDDQGVEMNEQNSCSKNSETFGQEHLRRLVFVVGHIALCQLNYLDVSVFNELKRRTNLRQQKKEKDDAAKKKASRRSKGGSTSNLETPRGGSNSKVIKANGRTSNTCAG